MTIQTLHTRVNRLLLFTVWTQKIWMYGILLLFSFFLLDFKQQKHKYPSIVHYERVRGGSREIWRPVVAQPLLTIQTSRHKTTPAENYLKRVEMVTSTKLKSLFHPAMWMRRTQQEGSLLLFILLQVCFLCLSSLTLLLRVVIRTWDYISTTYMSLEIYL